MQKNVKFIVMLLIFICTSLSANKTIINENTNSISILENSSLFIDKNSTQTIAEILKKNKKFTPILNEYINYGYRFKDTFWIKFTLQNSSDKAILKYLVFDSPNIDIINLHYYKDNREHLLKDGIFNRKSFKSELFFNFPLSLEANETQTYYLELKPITHSLHFSLKIQDYKTYKNEELHHQLILAVFFGILFVIIIYNAIIFINSKDSTYLYYSFFVLALFMHQLHIRGVIAYFLPANPEIFRIMAYSPIYNLSITVIAIFFFVRKFLNLQKYKKIYIVSKLFMLVIVVILTLHSRQNYILNYLTPVALLFTLYLECVGCYLYVKMKEKNAKYFFMIWSLSLGGMIETILYYDGILKHGIPYLLELTMTIEVLLFAIILASRIKDLQKEKIEKNKIICHQSKMISMGEMLQNIAHQWRQPLSEINAVAMRIDTSFYNKELTAKVLDREILRIEDITEHMSNTIESFNEYFRKDKEKTETTIAELVRKSLLILKTTVEQNDIAVDFRIDAYEKFKVNSGELTQVILVILSNAIDILVERDIKEKRILIFYRYVDDRHYLEIEDNAGGISEEIIDNIFDPYFSTKFKSQGVGIGLYMAKMLMQESLLGELSVINTKNGAKFTIKL